MTSSGVSARSAPPLTVAAGVFAFAAIIGTWVAFAAVEGTATLDAERYTVADTATLTVNDTDLNVDAGEVDTVPVNFKSDTDPSGILVTLDETGPNTGVFQRTATFTQSLPSSEPLRTLRVSAGDTVTLTYSDSSPAGDRTATAVMFINNATATFDQEAYTVNGTPVLTVNDVDGNLDSTAVETVGVGLVSDSDEIGITVELTETGADTGIFTGGATFTTGSSNDAEDELRVASGDTVTLTYNEPLFNGTATQAKTDTAAIETVGVASLRIQDGLTQVVTQRYAQTDEAILRVVDGDLNTGGGLQTVDVTFSSDTDPTGITVTLTESSTVSSRFQGTATFTTGASDDGNDVLSVSQDDTVTLTYEDAAPADTITASATIFVDDAEATLDRERYRRNQAPMLTVTDTDANADVSSAETISVRLFSTVDPTGINVDLDETGADTGVFTGSATFVAGTSSDVLDQLRVAAANTVTLRYAEPQFAGGTMPRDDSAFMFQDNATLNLDADSYVLGDTVTITVDDVDGNLDSTSIETVDVTFASTADPTGITVTVTETGNDTGVFTGPATFSDTASDDGTDVLLVDGGTVTATYDEPNFAGTGTNPKTDTATLPQTGTITLDSASYQLTDTATISVTDEDLNTAPESMQTVDVTFTSDSDGTGITVTLTETGNDTGEFTGTATFSDTASDDPTDVLLVAGGDTVAATYSDAARLDGTAGDATATASMLTDDATVAFDADDYALDDAAILTVTDADANADGDLAEAVDVDLSSTSDPGTISVTLTETGPDTGVFTGTATFSDTASDDDNDILLIAGGDVLTLTYDEPAFDGSTVTRTDFAIVLTDGSVVFDAARYALDDTVTLTVTDVDENVDPEAMDTVDVTLVSTSDGTGITVTLTETFANIGIFQGQATLSDTASDDPTDVLLVAAGDTLTGTYAETTTFAGPDADRTATATVHVDGTIELDQIEYQLNDTATITVTDADLNADAASAETVDVTFTSDTDPTGITVTLTETGNDTGVFTGTATFSTTASDDASDVLLVDAEDLLTATYSETTTFSGTDADRTDTATMQAADAEVEFDAFRYRLNDAEGNPTQATITVTDPDANMNAVEAETVGVTVTSASDDTGISVILTETDVNTGVFEGTLRFDPDASNDPPDKLFVADGDTVEVVYDEAAFAGSDFATMFADTATASLDAEVYALDDTAAITVDDVDGDLDPETAETVDVDLSSTSDVTGITVTLTETGNTTGIFTGSATFSDTASDDGTDVLLIAPGDDITLSYDEPDFEGTGTNVVTDVATAQTNGSIVLDAARYALEDMASLTVTDPDLNTDQGVADSVDVSLMSDSDGAGITVTLDETGVDTGIFTGTATVSAAATDDDADILNVSPGDLVTATYSETTTFEGPDADRIDTAGIDPSVTSADPDTRGRGVEGADITFTGEGFADGATTAFSAAGISVNSTTFVSSTELTVNIDIAPGADLGAGDITVTNPNGGLGTCTGCFTVTDAPGVTSASPDTLAQGVQDATITISGSGFVEGASASFSAAGVTVDSTQFVSANTLRAVIDIAGGATTGAGDVGVTNPDEGTMTCVGCFTVNAAALAFDFDASGGADLATGVPGEDVKGNNNAGAVSVIYSGSKLAAAGDQIWHQAKKGIVGAPQAGDRFGSALASGDFDGDGYADLAIGIPGEGIAGRNNAGAVSVIYGTAGGLRRAGDQIWHQNSAGIANKSQKRDGFGSALAAGDFNGDGFGDLAIGVPGENFKGTPDAGAVNVIYGTQDGLAAAGDQQWHQNRGGLEDSREDFDAFGFSLAAGDLDGDGIDDLAVGVPGETVNGRADAGGVHVLFGSGAGLTSTGDQFWTQGPGVKSKPKRGEAFGFSLAIGDFNAAGPVDLAIGVPGDSFGGNRGAGAVNILFSTDGTGPTAAGDTLLHQNKSGVRSSARAGEAFGWSLAAGNINGAGADDLAVGVPGERVGGNADAGAVHVFYGRSGGPTGQGDQLWHQNRKGIASAARRGEAFGFAVTLADLNGDGRADLAAGVPGETVGGNADAGAVNVIYSRGKLRAAGDQRWHQNRKGIASRAQAGDGFGAAL